MRSRLCTALSVPLALVLSVTGPQATRAQDTTRTTTITTTTTIADRKLAELLAGIKVDSAARDSLSKLADKAAGEAGSILEEQVWQKQLLVQAGILGAANELKEVGSQGGDSTAAIAVLQSALADGWPRYRRQIERRERMVTELLARRSGATPQERLEIETEFAEQAERIGKMLRDFVDAIIAGERLGIDAKVQREYIKERLVAMSEQTKVRMTVLGRAQSLAAAAVQRTPGDAAAQTELEIASAAFGQTTANLETEISLLKQMGMDVTDLKVALIVARGTLNSTIFDPGVIQGLFKHWRQQFVEMLFRRGPHWLFAGLMIVLILGGFGLLARVTKSVARRAVARTGLSQLLKDTLVGWSSRLVVLIGLLIVLKQFGVQLGPMLAGLGIAGFVLGFALQDTLSNFAAGGMILAYRPYDVGDTVEAGGAVGTVRHMSLVSTTILTADNQTLIVPNKKMWGDVIRNSTAQDKRRVDLIFAAGYENEVDRVEKLLLEIAGADERVLKDPAPVVKLNQLGDASLNFVVRVWSSQENYWDVYWDITRAVKLRFDKEGITFPQRAVNVNMIAARPDAPAQAAPPMEAK